MKLPLFLIGVFITSLLLYATPSRQEKEPIVKLTVTEWGVVIRGISKLPLEESQFVYSKIIMQVNQQLSDTAKHKK